MPKNSKKQPKRALTAKQRKAFEFYGANAGKGGTKADALRAAGYAPTVIDNPKRVFETATFSSELEKAGVSDKKVAKTYSRLLNSSRIESMTFDGWVEKRKWVYPTEQEIKIMIEGSPDDPTGCDVLYIRTDSKYHRRIATYRHPDNAAKVRVVELVGKVRSHFAPEKLAIVAHELSESERKFLEGINGK